MFFILGFGYLCVRHPLQVLGFGEPAMMIMMTTSRSRQISETLQLQTAVDFRGCLSPMTDGAVAAMSQSHAERAPATIRHGNRASHPF